MRTTWIILLIAIAAGVGMYFYFSGKGEPAAYDTITFSNTPDSILQKIKVFTADRPVEVFYRDSTWSLPDSTPLQKILNNRTTDSINKSYKEKTLVLTYDDRLYYDMDIIKPDSNASYEMDFQLIPAADSMIVQGKITQSSAGVLNFRNPMSNLYRSFVITYNQRLPDSLQTDIDSTAPVNKTTKTITVIKR